MSSLINRDRFRIELRNDGIIHVHFSKGVKIDLDCQNEMGECFKQLTTNKRPFIYTAEGTVAVTKEAQRNAREMDKDIPILASAVVVNNPAQRLLTDFYYFFKPSQHSLKVFTNFEKGVEWLKTQM